MFSVCHKKAHNLELHYTENLIKIKHTIPEISPFSDAQNIKIQRKLNAIIGCIHLKINISEIRHILLETHHMSLE